MSWLTWLQKNILPSCSNSPQTSEYPPSWLYNTLRLRHLDEMTKISMILKSEYTHQHPSTSEPDPPECRHAKKSVAITDKIFKSLFEQPAQFPFVNQNKRNNTSGNPQGIETRDYWCIKISVASAVWLSRPQAVQHRRRALLKTREISVCQSCSQPVIQTSVLSSEAINRIKCSIGRANSSQ